MSLACRRFRPAKKAAAKAPARKSLHDWAAANGVKKDAKMSEEQQQRCAKMLKAPAKVKGLVWTGIEA